jgi:HlyD family secretion protein
MNKKILWSVIGLVVLIFVLIMLKKMGIIGAEEGVRVATEKVERKTIIETVNASGKIYPVIEVKVSPDVSGEIVELNVAEGDSVRKGQVLARIYADIYLSERDQATATVTQQQAMLANARAQLSGQEAALQLAKTNFERQKALLEEKVISQAEFDQARTNYESALSSYNSTLQSIKSAEAQVRAATSMLERTNKDLGRTVVVAPMDGVVSLLSVKKGERVVGNSMMAGTEMMRIADMSKLEIRVDVGENDIPKVKIGDSAVVEVDAYSNKKFKGVVTQIASSSDNLVGTAATASTEVTNYKVYISLLPESYADLIDPENPRHFPFRPGMTASADIQTKRRNEVIAVPINAVTTREKGGDIVETNTESKGAGLQEENKNTVSKELEEVVFVVDSAGIVKRVVVNTGIQDFSYIEILNGLQEGEQIVVAPYNVINKTLRDGMKVKIVKREQLFENTAK